jgi:hypothetical protein
MDKILKLIKSLEKSLSFILRNRSIWFYRGVITGEIFFIFLFGSAVYVFVVLLRVLRLPELR